MSDRPDANAKLQATHDKLAEEERQRAAELAKAEEARDQEYKLRQQEELKRASELEQRKHEELQRQRDALWREEFGEDAVRRPEFQQAERRILEKGLSPEDQRRELEELTHRERALEQQRQVQLDHECDRSQQQEAGDRDHRNSAVQEVTDRQQVSPEQEQTDMATEQDIRRQYRMAQAAVTRDSRAKEDTGRED